MRQVQDFKDGAETDAQAGVRYSLADPVAGRIAPASRTARPVRAISILPPRIFPAPIFDISIVLVQYLVPFIALGRAVVRTFAITSPRHHTQCICHAVVLKIVPKIQLLLFKAFQLMVRVTVSFAINRLWS